MEATLPPPKSSCVARLGAVTASTASPCGGVTVVTVVPDLWHPHPGGGGGNQLSLRASNYEVVLRATKQEHQDIAFTAREHPLALPGD